MQCEEASPTPVQGHQHCCYNLWGGSQPSMWEANGEFEPFAQADTIPCKILVENKCMFKGSLSYILSNSCDE